MCPCVGGVRQLRNIVNLGSVKAGYEISFTCYCYMPQPLLPLQYDISPHVSVSWRGCLIAS